MKRPSVALITLVALGLTGARLRAPLELSPRPLPPSVVLRVQQSLTQAGIPNGPDNEGTGLLVPPAFLDDAQRVAALGQYDSELGPKERVPYLKELVRTLETLPRVKSVSLHAEGKETWIMLDAEGAIPLHDTLAFFGDEKANVKVLDAQGRDLTRPRPARNRSVWESTYSWDEYLPRHTGDLLTRLWQGEIDRELGAGRVRLGVEVVVNQAEVAVFGSGLAQLPQWTQELKVEAAEAPGVDHAQVQKLLVRFTKRLKVDPKRLKVNPSLWPASQRPITRLELERLKAGLLPPRQAPENRWLGLILLWPALALWGWVTCRLWERHNLGRR